ncbi:gamma carbonic anhydrase family protein [Tissierella pigra]|uniref:Gamma carbonic anhydrase family protein n=1 Tax=Tissierella pigra TaxID=2607614 RepID=A0A6N7XQH8_9FIRM|nr:gamma carbonic anhydrase family protein [Tissierella pigra]MBU5427350.1 gamma carbonic anhydrase family protein [Tissierella pigra]MSU03062.1 gamma carbonic anhydrase family protein [Tissierella pigra]
MIKNLKDKNPKIHEEAFIAETADVLGEVTIGKGTSIWYGAVVRGDMNTIEIGNYSNVQDNSSLHVDTNEPLKIGDYTTIGHNAVVHGCTVGNNCLIGMGAIILNSAVVGDNCIIGAGALVTEGAVIPPNSLVLGSPGKVRRELTEDDLKSIKDNAIRYEKLWREQHI